jgi:hypothetical protein
MGKNYGGNMRLSLASDNTWNNFRCWLYLVKDMSRSVNFQLVFWKRHFGAEIQIYGGDGERDLMFHFGCGLFAFWLTIEDIMPRKWQPDYKRRDSCERSVGVRIFDGNVWVNLWGSSMGSWSSGDPKWWSFTIPVVDWLLGKVSHESRDIKVIEDATLNICAHESYKAKVRLFESTWTRPRWFKKSIQRAEVSVEGGVIHPGKGTQSYNCDDDYLYSLTTPAETPREALNKFRDAVLDMRDRYPL